jgi:selenocysteine lyase/cysteine desulfurase
MDWHSVYEAYPVNREMIWLNNCGTTPAGTHIVQAVSRFIDAYSQKGVLTETADYSEVRNRIKTILASLLNCLPEELALIHNTAEGMNFISHGLPLAPGDEIILLENEYPSNVYPWLHWKEKGVKIQTAPAGDTPEDFIEGLKHMISSKTRMISLSAVHWCTGMPFPLEAAGKLCRDRGIDLVTDGAQGVGMVPLDVKKAGISYMAFPAWKWLMGPLGLGVLYISQEKIEELRPVFIGTESVIRDEEYLPYKSELKPTADRFTFSTANFNDWVYFLASLEFLNSIGFEQVRERILELSAHLREKLRPIGFQVMSDRFPSHPTGITVCEKPGTDSGKIMNRLKHHRNRIAAAERLGRIRFSPHIYNSPAQFEEVAKAIEGF